MTAPLTLLIVEDETPLAEMHAEYIRHIPGFSQILLAGNLAQARMMIERFKPGLILLDNYLPDGRGINLLHELVQAHYPGDVVFTTAASDMETVSEAVRCGVFDYLIKPIAYERLGQTLTVSASVNICWKVLIAPARSKLMRCLMPMLAVNPKTNCRPALTP
ncbi:two-component response regulator [Escherichia coli]|uniref:Transcriptional regulatory protein DpiA n=1 Tax=Escherichia coli TaxID=562 RepID=A0A485JI28_ECOLX|nr:two-component response regulator [Escherichia coli]